MNRKPYIVALTGAESTGKSTLAKVLAEHYHVPFVPEFAREHVRSLHGKYTFNDVEFIAHKQIEQYEKLLSEQHPVIILDTWLLITKVWFDVVFNRVPEWLEENIIKHKVDLFLVCDTDLPWEPDDVRENGGENRNKLQQRYIDEIKNKQLRYKLVQGSGQIRTQNAIDLIQNERYKDQQI
ncbi:MAG TPA: ATP-binding protein [Draconibacterium sp.]|nr:ATP-binding protein [Draconibacterium sp.]